MALSQEQWEARYIAHFAHVVQDAAAQDPTAATEWARSDLQAAGFLQIVRGYEEDPEGSAEESLSYYEADEV